jgi:excinuclease ABC subunit C
MAVMESRGSLLENDLENAPSKPGVYLMRDPEGRVLYVGKAVNLRSRIRAYFGRTDGRAMIPFLVRRVDRVEFIVTETEKEALILENTLIKKYRPRYNVTLRDDKNYFSIRIDPREDFPRFQLVRKVRRDRARYFGPYASSAAVRETLRVLQPVFPLRTCGDLELRSRTRPCIEYEMKRCLGPCRRLVDGNAYGQIVREAVSFLEGRGTRLLSDLKAKMAALSREMRFEEAARVRDRIAALVETLEKQRAVSPVRKDRDVFGLFRSGDRIQCTLLYIRQGKIQGQKPFPLLKSRASTEEVLSAVVKQYYDREVFLPEWILLPAKIEDRAAVEAWLREKKGGRVRVLQPRSGDGAALLRMALGNAETLFDAGRKGETDREKLLALMKERLRLKNLPRRIECYDISNVGGEYSVGSRVVFQDGLPDPGGYRHFRIRLAEGPDDCAMMGEVLRRRFEGPEEPPDLVVVDGGKGQLNAALSVLSDLAVSGVDALGLAKERREEERPGEAGKPPGRVSRGEDRAYLPGRKNPLYLSRSPELLLLLSRIRDEAHRFAVSRHRKLREREAFDSPLESVPGIGPAGRRKLLARFGSLEGVMNAAEEELAAAGIGRKRAALLREFLDRAGKGGKGSDG